MMEPNWSEKRQGGVFAGNKRKGFKSKQWSEKRGGLTLVLSFIRMVFDQGQWSSIRVVLSGWSFIRMIFLQMVLNQCGLWSGVHCAGIHTLDTFVTQYSGAGCSVQTPVCTLTAHEHVHKLWQCFRKERDWQLDQRSVSLKSDGGDGGINWFGGGGHLEE